MQVSLHTPLKVRLDVLFPADQVQRHSQDRQMVWKKVLELLDLVKGERLHDFSLVASCHEICKITKSDVEILHVGSLVDFPEPGYQNFYAGLLHDFPYRGIVCRQLVVVRMSWVDVPLVDFSARELPEMRFRFRLVEDQGKSPRILVNYSNDRCADTGCLVWFLISQFNPPPSG